MPGASDPDARGAEAPALRALAEQADAPAPGRLDAAQAAAVPAARTRRDLERLLARVKHDLAHLPRHEWDSYLWNLCSALVQVHRRGPPVAPVERDGDPRNASE